jgi:hypothetical protein
MNITFGIVTHGQNPDLLKQAKQSIYKNFHLEDELIIVYDDRAVFGYDRSDGGITFNGLGCDFTEKPGMICHKKNMIVSQAQNPVVVLMHDYLSLNEDWRSQWDDFGYDWDIACNRIVNTDGSRFRDYCSWDDPKNPPAWMQVEPWCLEGRFCAGTPKLEKYDYENPYWYISGAYYLIKRDFAMNNKLDESLLHCHAEDVEFCLRIRDKANYKFNRSAVCRLLRNKDVVLGEANV